MPGGALSRRAQVHLTHVAAAAVVGLALAGAYIFYLPSVPTPSSISSSSEDSVVTSNASSFFPVGYYSHQVNFSLTQSGDVIQIGGYSFLYVVPTNLETRTLTMGSGGERTTTVAVVTADYQCGTSLGQRRFFFVQVPGVAGGPAYTLDYCLLLNSAIAGGSVQEGAAHPWDLWQIVPSSPVVALHMTGVGGSVSWVELCVSK